MISNVTKLEQKVDKLEIEELPALKKMVRNSIRKSKENYSSIDELKKAIHHHDFGPGSPSQYSPNNFDMINTIMVVYNFSETSHSKFRCS